MSSGSLWGEEFEIKKPETKQIIKKAKNPKKVTTVVKKKKDEDIPIEIRLENIRENVKNILGQYSTNIVCIDNYNDFCFYIDKAIKDNELAVDTETNNTLDTVSCKIMGLCLYSPSQKSAYIPVNHINRLSGEKLENQVTEKQINEQLQRVKDSKCKVIMHNGKFDYKVLKQTCNIELPIYWDTMIGARMLDENELSAGLKDQYRLKIDPSADRYDIEHLFEKLPYEIFEPELFALYAATDAYKTYYLYKWQEEQFNKPGNERLKNVFMNIEMPVIPVAAEMEQTGVCIDKEYAERLSQKYHRYLEEAEKEIDNVLLQYKDVISEWRKTPEANKKPLSKKPNKDGEYTLQKSKNEQLKDPPEVNSPTQFAILLYDVLKVPVVDSKSPRGTGEEVLTKINNPLCQAVLRKRGLDKLIGTYIDKIPKCVSDKDGRLHASFNQLGTSTGRFSCVAEGTKVSTPAGDKEIESILPGDYVYCFDTDSNSLTLSQVKHVWNNGKRECIKISWESKYNKKLEGELICTPDHFIRTYNRGWVMAKDLTFEDSILYVHRRENENSVSIYSNFISNEEEHLLLKDIYFHAPGKRYNIHHKDGNRLNNDPRNLMIVTPKAHTNTHLASNLQSSEHFCNRYNFSEKELIEIAESVNWELNDLPYDHDTCIRWYQQYHINYILKYTENYSKRKYFNNGKGLSKNLHLPLTKNNIEYALFLSKGNTVLSSSYFAVSESEFLERCRKYNLVSNHNITSIQKLDTLYNVYDLEIEKYHNFIANELCVHNCNEPNLQNIPSHDRAIRLMFKASNNEFEIEQKDNYYLVDKWDKVETDNGWEKVYDLKIGDILQGDKISNIEIRDSKYRIFVD